MRVTADKLRKLLARDPETGVFRWREKPNKRIAAGTVAGCVATTNGYIYIMIERRRYLAHRLAWLYVYGEWPENEIDHVDRDRTNNRLSNLRPATRSQNGKNYSMPKTNTSGVKGVGWNKALQKWQARIRANGKMRHLGYFHAIADAEAAYVAAAKEHFGEFSG